jgi:hypothetical protein
VNLIELNDGVKWNLVDIHYKWQLFVSLHKKHNKHNIKLDIFISIREGQKYFIYAPDDACIDRNISNFMLIMFFVKRNQVFSVIV